MGLFTHKLTIQLEEIRHKHRLEMAEKQAQFDREKHVWEEDKKRLEADLKKDHEIKLREVLSLTKLDSEQRSKQQELDYKRKISELEAANVKQMAEFQARLSQEYYESLSKAMTKLHEEGNVTTKFTQELALKMLENAPKAKVNVKTVNATKQLEKPKA